MIARPFPNHIKNSLFLHVEIVCSLPAFTMTTSNLLAATHCRYLLQTCDENSLFSLLDDLATGAELTLE